MHEMSIVESLLNSVETELRRYPGARVQTVRVRVGQLRLVEPMMLQLCYEAATQGQPLSGSRLEVVRVEASARCQVCSLTFPVDESWFECPRCHSTDAELLAGDELVLANIIIESDPQSPQNASGGPFHCHA